MDIKQASGVPLPDASLPAGTVSVRVVRGSFANNLSGVDVVFSANGKTTTVKTADGGRAQVAGLARGTRVTATAVVDGERLQSQEVTIADGGIRFVLVASGAATPAAAPVAAPPAVPPTGAAVQGMDLKQASGVPLPAGDLPAGTISVRVIRGSFANNLVGVDVRFVIDGKATTVKTVDGGRAQVSGLTRGARVKASATVGKETLETQEITVADGGVRFVLVATDDSAPAASAAAPVSAAPIPGQVTFGPESRIVADYADERLNIYYAIQVVNPAAAPVDTGGPIVLVLPSAAKGASLMDGASPQASVSGARVTVLGPFAPGITAINVAYEMPYSGPTAHIEQRWPVAAQSVSVFALKTGDIDLASPQLTAKQSSVQQGQALVMGLLPAVPAGQVLALDITGLPHHDIWPRYVALGAAGFIASIGLWAAFIPGTRRRHA
jgi:hypothetical protein